MPTYAFRARRNYTDAQLRALDTVQQQQVMLAAHAYSGETFATLDEVIAGLGNMLGEVDLDHYEITADGDAKFEMWVIATDNGMVFPLGSDEPTAVHCSQSNFWSVDDGDADAIELANALNAIVPF